MLLKIPLYHVDAFADELFGGNPAAVMPLERWLADELLQSIAAENNLSETAFLVAGQDGYELRWFTPTVEVDLCGHATLASAHVLYEHLGYAGESVRFFTRSGELGVSRDGSGITMDFPGQRMVEAPVDEAVSRALGAVPEAVVIAAENPTMAVYVFASETDVAALEPDFRALRLASKHAIIATAPGARHDFVSRFFGPQLGIDEDPVTGSAHCCLVPYWARRLGRDELNARQISARGGELLCRWCDGRVVMTGRAVTYLQGAVFLPRLAG
jgi:PhzF family phenazine biosynthesis protein